MPLRKRIAPVHVSGIRLAFIERTKLLLHEEYTMKTKYTPLLAIVLAMLVIAAVVAPGALAGDEGATLETVAAAESGAATVDEPALGEDADETVANCRFGVATNKNSSQYQWIDDVGAGWWLSFQPDYTTPPANGAEYAHLVWVQQKKNANGDYLDDFIVNPPMSNNSLGYLLQRRPGRLWIIGNEIDRGPNSDGSPGQGDTMPQMYARIYHDVYHYIKQWDPTALVTPSSLVQFTPGRAQYLDIVYDTYLALYRKPMPVDLWNMHLYALPELRTDGTPNDIASVAVGTDPALGIYESGGWASRCPLDNVYCLAEHDDLDVFADQVVRMRTWMKNHGYQNYPLIITEYSLLYNYEVRGDTCSVMDEYGECFDPPRVKAFASGSFDYLLNAKDPELGYPYDGGRLVQQWMWYSMHRVGNFSASNIAMNDYSPLHLTQPGQAFYDAAHADPATINLMTTEVHDAAGRVSGEAGTISANLSIEMRNNGNTRVNRPIKVTFYRDAALKKVMGTATVPAPDADFVGMTGCAVRGLTVTVNAVWEETLSPGNYPFWVKVDSDNSIAEPNEADNIATGTFLVPVESVHLPVLLR